MGEGVEEDALEVGEAALGPHVRPPLQLRDLVHWSESLFWRWWSLGVDERVRVGVVWLEVR